VRSTLPFPGPLLTLYSGIGLALVGAIKGYKTIITLPEKMSPEKVAVLRALGATIIRTPTQAAFDSPESHIGVAKRLQKEIPNSHILDQYANENNPLAHEYGTAEEIWAQTGGKITAIVAGAGTGGTISGLAKGLRKHNPDIKVIAADPFGSILALPESLNQEHANEAYKVEGIGYDFIPDVLTRELVDVWYKTADRESFALARRLIAEEGILVGGSSGSAMSAMIQGVRDLKLGKGDVVVVILPDSIRSYLSKFADDDWLAANDLLPQTPPGTSPSSPSLAPSKSKDAYSGATLRSLRLKPVTTVLADSACADAIETMREKGFDQLPVLAPTGGKLVGLVTLGNLLSYISRGRATGKSPVSEVMFDFSSIPEVVTDPKDISHLSQPPKTNGIETTKGGKEQKMPKRKFVQITLDTPLSALSKFFEWNSAAIVTEDGGVENGSLPKPVAVVTKVDLLSWLVKQGKAE
jgi:cystathionine beta-synthase